MPSLNPIGKPFIELLSVESTNNYAMGLARAGMAQHGTTVFTHEQTKGKGQRNKEWTSEKGKNIAMSILIESGSFSSSGAFLLSMMVAVGVHEFILKYAKDDVKIKWPNDIYWRDRKAAGILIENVWQGSEWKYAIVGIGININQTDFGALGSRAASLKQISGRELEPLTLAKELCEIMQGKHESLKRSPQLITKGYKEHLYKLNNIVRLKQENRLFDATVKDVSLNGELVVQHAIEEKFNVGEVEWIVNGG